MVPPDSPPLAVQVAGADHLLLETQETGVAGESTVEPVVAAGPPSMLSGIPVQVVPDTTVS
jgi:hypothetical protein